MASKRIFFFFAVSLGYHCLVSFSPHYPRVTDIDAFLRSWDDLLAHAFTSFALFRGGLISLCSLYLFFDVCDFLVATEEMVYGFSELGVSSSSSVPCATRQAAAVALPSLSFSSPCASVFMCGDFLECVRELGSHVRWTNSFLNVFQLFFQWVSASLAVLQ